MLDQLEPVVSDLVVTRNSSPRSMEVAKLADLSEAVFGPDRVHVGCPPGQAIEKRWRSPTRPRRPAAARRA